ncbi:MAG: nucleolar complex protein 14 [Thelocarpon impressellum]|nr:MAG: nucleolar complex protein 14 [Thelocarpon impressellum]
MPPSQLKRLKASLKAEGIVGPQRSKKQRKKDGSNGANADKRVHRSVALQNIREQFNPFEVQAPARDKAKFEVTNNRTIGGRVTKEVKGRPGVTKGFGEETRRRTLLTEIQRRNKVGGILDRRFGENDPTMAPEDKILERFTKEKQRGLKRGAMFDLEDDDAEEGELTHLGQTLAFDESTAVDDFDAEVALSADENDGQAHKSLKRRRSSASDEHGGFENEDNGRKKSKAEVMKEVMAKSKYHKYERQQAKDEDEDEREQLDKELPTLLALMRAGNGPVVPSRASLKEPSEDAAMNPQRAAMIERYDKSKADQDYDVQLRQMAMDKRSQPTERTKTEEEKAKEEANRLRDLEERRLRRMRGEDESSDEEALVPTNKAEDGDDADLDDAEAFGFGSGITGRPLDNPVDVEDEDDFVLDRDLIASGSDVDETDSSDASGSKGVHDEQHDQEDDDFMSGLLKFGEHGEPRSVHDATGSNEPGYHTGTGLDRGLAYTYPCPQNHEELLLLTATVSKDDRAEVYKVENLPIIIQRIRTLYHPKLHSGNKEKLGRFAATLVDHVSYLANQPTHPPFQVLETVIRHIHSLAKAHPVDVGNAFRAHLQALHQKRPLAPTAGDLVILTTVATVFPTSDHFHQVVTPAILCMARYLEQKLPSTLSDLAIGAYFETLCLQYQRISKRYVPEILNYALNAVSMLAPVDPGSMPASVPLRLPPTSLRLQKPPTTELRALRFWDIIDVSEDGDRLKAALLEVYISLLGSMADLWATKSASHEVFECVTNVLQRLDRKDCRAMLAASTTMKVSRTLEKLQQVIAHSHATRRPLALHHHRPLAIKTSIPKFEEGYNLDKHYDPDRERSEMSKLRAEHKRERKGAMRELRKDANFIARESLKEKKERDREYEKKYKRLVAEIQGEEGREAKLYEREKRLRKGKR